MKLEQGRRYTAEQLGPEDEADPERDVFVLAAPKSGSLVRPGFREHWTGPEPKELFGIYQVNRRSLGREWMTLRICDTGDLEFEVVEAVEYSEDREWVIRRVR